MKKAILMVLLAALLATPLAGCDKADNGDEPTKTTTESKENGDNIPDYNAADANPASDFEYKVGEDGGITITKYIGTDTDVVIPEKIDGKNVTVIYMHAFRRSIIVNVIMPDTVTTIDEAAFELCESLTTVRLSTRLSHIDNSAFKNCTSLSTITLPPTLNSIYDWAFMYCTSLKHINIPKSISLFGAEVFAGSGLETVDFEEGLKCIGESAFINSKLKTISIPSSVKCLTSMVFAGNKDLKSVTLHEGLEEIAHSAFAGSQLTEIVIPSTVKILEELAFHQCSSLQSVKFNGNAPEGFTGEWVGVDDVNYTIYYHEGATGFTSPEWNGYKTEIW